MKIIPPLVLLLVSSLSMSAQGGPPSWAGQGHSRDAAPSHVSVPSEDLMALDRFLSLTDDQLEQLQQAIAKVRAMKPEERAALRKQMAEFRNLSPEQREKVRKGWGWLTEQDRNDWPSMMQACSEAERSEIQTQLRALSPDKRALRKHELLEAWRKTTAK